MADSDDCGNTRPRSTGPRTPAGKARAAVKHPDILTIDRNRLIQILRSARRFALSAPQEKFLENPPSESTQTIDLN